MSIRKNIKDTEVSKNFIRNFAKNIITKDMSPTQLVSWEGFIEKSDSFSISDRVPLSGSQNHVRNVPSNPKKIHYYVMLHDLYGTHHHQNFFPWHRKFLIEFQNDLGMPIPYWNWFENQSVPEMIQLSSLRNYDFSFLNNSTTEQVVKDYFLSLYRESESILDADKPNSSVNIEADIRDLWNATHEYIGREKSNFIWFRHFARHWEGMRNRRTRIVLRKNGKTKRRRLKFSFHDWVHGSTGGSDTDYFGHMTKPATAPFDPIFWLHHSFMEKIWIDLESSLSAESRKKFYKKIPTQKLKYFGAQFADLYDHEQLDIRYDKKISENWEVER